MKILVCGFHRRRLPDIYLESFVCRLARFYLEKSEIHQVVFLTGEEGLPGVPEKAVLLEVKQSGSLLGRLWEKKSIRQMIRQQNPDIVLSMDTGFAPHGIDEFVIITQDLKNADRAKKNGKAVFLSHYLRDSFRTGSSSPVLPLQGGVFFQPVDWDERETIKQQYTDGREYFFCSAFHTSLEQVTIVLKAFSMFKKWQNSSVKLLISETGGLHEALQKLLAHYKYRGDVVIFSSNDIEEEARVAVASFAVVYLPADDYTGLRVLNYLQADLPVFTCEAGAIREMAGDGVIYCDKNSVEDIATKLKTIYKDEKFRSRVTGSGRLALQEKIKEFEARRTVMQFPLG